MSLRFRKLPKDQITLRLPPKLAKRIRHESVNREESMALVISRLICAGLGVDPTKFGLDDAPAPVPTESPN